VAFEFEMIDFQNIKEGEPVYGRFAFSNGSSDTLEIELVSACNCMEIEWSQGPILPQQGGEILFKFNSKGEKGDVFKTLDIIFKNTDERGYPVVKQVYLKGKVSG
jgi:hypothetical protein